MEIKRKEEVFNPFTIDITIESEEEKGMLLNLFGLDSSIPKIYQDTFNKDGDKVKSFMDRFYNTL